MRVCIGCPFSKGYFHICQLLVQATDAAFSSARFPLIGIGAV